MLLSLPNSAKLKKVSLLFFFLPSCLHLRTFAAVVIFDTYLQRSKGYGFVTFVTCEAAEVALEQPFKEIDGRLTEVRLCVCFCLVPLKFPCMVDDFGCPRQAHVAEWRPGGASSLASSPDPWSDASRCALRSECAALVSFSFFLCAILRQCSWTLPFLQCAEWVAMGRNTSHFIIHTPITAVSITSRTHITRMCMKPQFVDRHHMAGMNSAIKLLNINRAGEPAFFNVLVPYCACPCFSDHTRLLS